MHASGRDPAWRLADALIPVLREAPQPTDPEEARRVAFTLPFSNMSREEWSTSVALWLKHGPELLAQQQARACPACGTSEHEPLFNSYDGHPYVACIDCGTWYVPLEIDHALYERFFKACPQAAPLGDYTQKQAKDLRAAKSDEVRFHDYYRGIRRLIHGIQEPSALDIGAVSAIH